MSTRHSATVAIRAAGLIVAAMLLSPVPLAQAKDKGLDPAIVAMKDCPSEPGCPAIIILDETELSNEKLQARTSRRQMLKVFTEAGIQDYLDVEVTALVGGQEIHNLAGRTILPDGKVIDLKQDNIFVKTSAKKGRHRLRTKTAKFPGVVPGAVIEYSYDLISPQAANITNYIWELQRPLPVLTSTLTIKQGELAFSIINSGLQHVSVSRTYPFKGITQLKATNIPSIPEEPLGPPADALRARVYLHLPALQATWLGEMAGRLAGRTGEFLGDAQAVHTKVEELVQLQDPPIEKVKKIYQFVQQKVGTEEVRAEMTEESQVKDPNNIDEVLIRGYGDEFERTLLFIAMAREAGLPAAVLYIVPRDSGIFDLEAPDEDQFDAFAAAVETGGTTWTFYDPAVKHCPFGMISANKEGGIPNAILVTPQKGAGSRYVDIISNTYIPRYRQGNFSTATVPISAASKNILTREATVALAADGTTTVDVSEQGLGQVDLDRRVTYLALDEEKRKESLLEEIQRFQPRATLVSSEFQDLESFEKPAVIKYKVTIPDSALSMADRIILTPSLFDAGRPVPFTQDKRLTPVHFQHTQKTVERVTFEIPAGYKVGELPKSAMIREGPFLMATTYANTDGMLVFSRRLEIDAAIWPVEAYLQLKSFFEKVQEADRQVVILTKGGGS